MSAVKHKKLIALLLAIFLSGCASIPSQLLIVRLDTTSTPITTPGECDPDRLTSDQLVLPLAQRTLDAQRFSLLSWNIYKQQRENWLDDFLRYSTEQDIVLLQEAYLDQDLKMALAEKRLHWRLNAAFYLNGVETGVMTASKVKPDYSCGLRTLEPFIRTPKTILISRFQLSRTKNHLLVANIHAINFSLGTEAYEAQINAMQEILAKHSGPIIVAGDFNNWNKQRSDIVENMVFALGLSAISYRDQNRITIFGNTIDHIYYRGLRQLTQETIEVSSSDHNLIKVTFGIISTLVH